MATLNLGILAHVDAGKTTLTERLLHAAGVIDAVGSVDDGTTQTDTMALERERGITIRAAVAAFRIDDLAVNLVDTPGHPDFIAEVDRALGVLDGAVLVVSAVEGVQAQTVVLMRALQRLRVPTLIFVNKIDRGGADPDRAVSMIRERLSADAIPMGSTRHAGHPSASFVPHGRDDGVAEVVVETLSDHSDSILAAYVDDSIGLPYEQVRHELARQTKHATVYPVFFGSAITGAGVRSLMVGLVELLPRAPADVDGPASGVVFKVDRGSAGEKVAYVRMFSGTVRLRDAVRIGGSAEDKVSGISVFDDGVTVRRTWIGAGEIGMLRGLRQARVGEALGSEPATGDRYHFAPPTLETAISPHRAGDKGLLWVALSQLAEQDPLINVRQDDIRHDIYVSLYGEVQKEVIQATLAADFGLDVVFRETTTVCVERPVGIGGAVEFLNAASNPFLATVGLRVDPAPADSGVDFRLDVDSADVPLYLYKNVRGFADLMGQYVRQALGEGLSGWRVTDCSVTMTHCTYSNWDGRPATRGPLSTAADFRHLTPLVLMAALRRAGTVICEPIMRVRLDVPVGTINRLLPVLARLGAAAALTSTQARFATIETAMGTDGLRELQRRLPGLTGGEGVLESSFARYQPVSGRRPTRARTTVSPLNRKEYLRQVLGRRGSSEHGLSDSR